jgi:hypothetical protein
LATGSPANSKSVDIKCEFLSRQGTDPADYVISVARSESVSGGDGCDGRWQVINYTAEALKAEFAMRRHVVFLLMLASAVFAQPVQFNRDIRPILSDKCFACHGPDAVARKIKLRLDSETAAKMDLGGRFAIVPGDPEKSQLVRRITAENPAMRMPPVTSGVRLTIDEIDLLRRWIAEGAQWQKHWSFIPPEPSQAPAVKLASWPRNPIDRFVLARLERLGLEPSPEADRATLIRRVSLDLIGLPPTPEEVKEFVRDSAPNAYEKVVDRLLASPRFGEKMAVRWLDAARYADTNGYQTDAERHMWRWRDWVIDAFNKNMPFDQFTVEQIGGDLLPNATLEQKIATGFSRNHRGNSEGGIVPEEYLVEYAVDRVETMSTVFLGVTVGCARCHNHKYDPFTQREFYQLLAYFNNIPEIGRYLKYGNTPPFIKAPTHEQQKKLQSLEKAVAEAERAFDEAGDELRAAQRAWEANVPAGSDWSLGDGLKAHLPLDEKGTPGIVGDAARFDGKRVFDAGDKGAFGFYDKFSAAAWIRAETGTGPIVTRAEDKIDGEGWGLYLEDGKLQVNLIKRRLDDSIRVETKTKLESGRWYHVAFTYDGSRLAGGVRIYVNGKSQDLSILLDAINQDFRTKEPLRVGGGGGPEVRFTGLVDEVRVYGSALTDAEVGMLAVARSVSEIAATPEASRTPAEANKLRRAFLEHDAPLSIRKQWTLRDGARKARESFIDSVPTVMVMQENAVPKDTFVLVRGAYDRPGEKVSRGVPEVLPPLPAGMPNTRLALAKWLVDPAHPLTARVTVNRFWQMYFGTGIVKTVEDFGSQGEWPSHPDLLDWLATEFIRSGWDVKALQKTIVMSATYRQASKASAELLAKDPENRLLARAPRLRLPAEVLRDQALYASGLLVEKIGGSSVKPYQPPGLWSELGDKDYEKDSGENLYRRSLYTFWKRTAPPPFMTNFDSAMRESCTVRESRTNTPLQALNLMNDVTFVEAARALAQRGIRESGENADKRLSRIFQLVLARTPQDWELTKLRNSLAFYRDHYSTEIKAAEELVSQGDSPRDQGIEPRELAAYTAVSSLILNLDEAVTKE